MSVMFEVNDTAVKKSKMSRKCPSNWTLVDENIENVEHVKLDPEMQRGLGCFVGEHVFLEYPWAYVKRDLVTYLSNLSESSLARFQQRIHSYKADTFLLGYSSTRLISDEFVICLSEDAKRVVSERNRDISKYIWNKVANKVRKQAKPWRCLGSEFEVDETFVKNTRELFEVEIVLPGRLLGTNRKLCDRSSNDSRDSYAQLVNANENFENVERKCIDRVVQTHLPTREAFVQTCLENPRNAWTQYVYEDILKDALVGEEGLEEDGESDDKSDKNVDERSREDKDIEQAIRDKSPLELFLESRSPMMIDVIRYNAAMNLYVDDVQSLSRFEHKIETLSETNTFQERCSFSDFDLAVDKTISDVCVRSELTEYLAISYISASTRISVNEMMNEREFRSRVLLWTFRDPLRPRLSLQDHREIYRVCFCPYDDDLVIGGCSSGQVIVWNIGEYWSNDRTDKYIKFRRSSRNNVPVVRPIIVSDKHSSHCLPVRTIRWIPANYRIEPNGKLTKSSVSSSAQFLTASEDGTVAFWNLSVRSKHIVRGDEIFQPVFRLRVPNSSQEPRNFNLLCLCLPSIKVLDERDLRETSREISHDRSNSNGTRYTKSLWIGCTEGLIKCRWEEQPEGTVETVECKILSRSYAHDGPVTEITRSPHHQDVLLTIGGRVFAIWRDDYLDSPVFRRRARKYTTCCWANEPGVFVLGTVDGILEIWDIKNEPNQPVFSRVVSSRSISSLITLDYSASKGSKMIGAGDQNGHFRVFEEPQIFRSGQTSVERMDWFEEYIWREVRRKRVFSGWQEDFLANDPVMTAKRATRHDEERKREEEKARERLRRERETRLKSKAEKRVRSAPLPKDVAWKSKEYHRMKSVLLSKKGSWYNMHGMRVSCVASSNPLVSFRRSDSFHRLFIMVFRLRIVDSRGA
ncbi:dynein axonemal intermediate chain 3-like isoform X1 [Megachile rotundata]|uniref:dynein axonemal intermediate chain 3-like isoform X1 n=1 Tax=Megachile rotundata TaxID=143995 RepID=UPI003FCEEB51